MVKMDKTFYTTMVVEETKKNVFKRQIREALVQDLPDNDVLIRVLYSSLNYKDALSATGNRGVTRVYPHTPGIDASGIVEESRDSSVKKGEKVIVTSYDLGMNTKGGFGQYIRVPAGWVVKMPKGLDEKESMIFGTAGFTAGMSVFKLIRTIRPGHGDILVTGATGGGGSMAVAILSRLGYSVVALSGKPDTGFLGRLGARAVISRKEFLAETAPLVLKPCFAGVIDTVGGEILATAVKSLKQDGIVTACGNVASPDLPLNVYPFILRGVSLLGIDSQHCPMDLRAMIWEKLSQEWKFDLLYSIYEETDLHGLDEKIDLILKGELKGRTLVNLN